MAIDTLGANALASNSVTTAKIAADAVTSAKIPAGAVVASDVADGSVTTTKLADNAVTSAKALNLGRRNIAINGGMQVAQRATSVSSISSGGSYHTCDRWRLAIDTSGTWTQTQETLAITDPPFVQHGHTKALKMDCTTANGSLSAGSYIQLQHRIEGHDLQRIRTGTSNPAPVTISFWVKATKTGTNIVNVYQDEGGKQVAFSYTINASNTWEHKSITIPGNTHDAINNDNTRGRQFTWYLSAGSNRTSGSLQSTWQNYATGDEAVGQVNHADNTANNFHLTGVQIEQGSSATDFEHRSLGEELQLCKRYFQKFNYSSNTSTATTSNSLPVNCCFNGTVAYGGFGLPVEMRTSGTFSASAANTWIYYTAGNSYTPSVFTAYEMSPHTWGMRYDTSGSWTGGNAVYGRPTTTSSYWQVDAEI